MPVTRLLEGEIEKLVHMEDRLHRRVIGQDEAVEAVAAALRRSRAGLQDPDRPIGTFLFLGPTGVGKTELARALAEFMFDTQDAMVRIDMSEYMEKHSVSRLVGAPPGYVGYEEGGQLTEAVRRRPYSVVLLDEIEKAHPDVFNALLQVMDDGRLTDGQGRTVSFKNVVLLMTSNIPGGRTGAEGHFKPEFINRLDDIVEFDSLTRDQIGTIVDLQVALVLRRVSEREITVQLTDEARTLLGNLGYDPTYGARPLKRVIQKRLVDPLALAILEGRFVAGDTIGVGAAGGELMFERASCGTKAPTAGRERRATAGVHILTAACMQDVALLLPDRFAVFVTIQGVSVQAHGVRHDDRVPLRQGAAARRPLPRGRAALRERGRARDLEISRTPVREAFLLLEAEGLLELYPRRGALVTPISPTESDDVLEARLLIEGHCAGCLHPSGPRPGRGARRRDRPPGALGPGRRRRVPRVQRRRPRLPRDDRRLPRQPDPHPRQ